MLLQKYSRLSTQYNTLEDGERVLTLITTFLPSYNIPIFKKMLRPLSSLFLKMCCICVLFTRCKFPVTDKIMCGSRKNPYLSPPPRIFHSRGSLITSPLPHSPLEFPEFLNRDFLPPSEIQSGFGTSKRRKWILTQLWNTVKFYYNSVNFCQAY